jgi:hypothetical protein
MPMRILLKVGPGKSEREFSRGKMVDIVCVEVWESVYFGIKIVRFQIHKINARSFILGLFQFVFSKRLRIRPVAIFKVVHRRDRLLGSENGEIV